jgi:antitoxin VapB
MKTAKIFKNGQSQAVRLPREFRFDDTEVFIKKSGNVIYLIPRNNSWASLIDSLDKFYVSQLYCRLDSIAQAFNGNTGLFRISRNQKFQFWDV